MNNIDPMENDGPLHKTLAEWQVAAPVPPRFREDVWRRIEHAGRSGEADGVLAWARFLNRLANAFARPVPALLYVTAALMISLTAGFLQARQHEGQWNKALSQRYLQTVNAYHRPAGL